MRVPTRLVEVQAPSVIYETRPRWLVTCIGAPGTTGHDFQLLRTTQDAALAPFLAASIFLDVLNVFLFFLTIFSGPQGAER